MSPARERDPQMSDSELKATLLEDVRRYHKELDGENDGEFVPGVTEVWPCSTPTTGSRWSRRRWTCG
jgi:hypothetical protein